MDIARDTVVTLTYELKDVQGNVYEEDGSEMTYLHGGYDGIFPRVEEALQGKPVGHQLSIRLEPDDAFGEYDDQLLRVEPRNAFPKNVEVGMQFEGAPEGSGSDDFILYTITDVADDKVVVDGNHPLAGIALQFTCTVADVRAASRDEVEHGHAHDEHDDHH